MRNTCHYLEMSSSVTERASACVGDGGELHLVLELMSGGKLLGESFVLQVASLIALFFY